MNPAFKEEFEYWEEWLKTRGKCQDLFPHEYEERLDPYLPLQFEIEKLLPRESRVARILDVGSGPLTHVGKFHPNITLEVVALDALADEYNQLLETCGVIPPIMVVKGDAEKLLSYFNPDFFDVVCFRNSFDHCPRPLPSFVAALSVAKTGGYVFLQHEEFEGQKAEYTGLHQWDLYSRDGSFFVSDKVGNTFNFSLLFQGVAQLECSYDVFGWLVVTAKKIVTGVVNV